MGFEFCLVTMLLITSNQWLDDFDFMVVLKEKALSHYGIPYMPCVGSEGLISLYLYINKEPK